MIDGQKGESGGAGRDPIIRGMQSLRTTGTGKRRQNLVVQEGRHKVGACDLQAGAGGWNR
jgi:hypothetical protein